MVDGLEETYGAQMDFHQKEYSTATSKAEIKKYGIPGQHGMVILGTDGKVKWLEGGHKQRREVVEAQVQQVLAPPHGEETESPG